MRCCYIIYSLENKGGLERIWTDKMNYLADIFHYEVYCICISQQNISGNAYELSDKVVQIRLGIEPEKNSIRSILKCLKRKIRIIKNLRTNLSIIKPDVVITSTYAPFFYYPMKASRVLESHVAIATLSTSLYLKYCVRKCDVLVALTKQDARCWAKASRVTVIPNFTNIKAAAKYDYRLKRVMAVGRLVPQKGFDLLIKAWKLVSERHEDWSLDIYGDGWMKHQLNSLIVSYSLNDKVFLKDSVDDIAAAYSRHSVFVLSSRYEGFGLVLIEAMNCGLPSVSFDCPFGPSDIVENNKTGLLVEYTSLSDELRVQKLADAINMLIEHDDMRKSMSRCAIDSVSRFDKDVVMNRWKSLFESVADSRKSKG